MSSVTNVDEKGEGRKHVEHVSPAEASISVACRYQTRTPVTGLTPVRRCGRRG